MELTALLVFVLIFYFIHSLSKRVSQLEETLSRRERAQPEAFGQVPHIVDKEWQRHDSVSHQEGGSFNKSSEEYHLSVPQAPSFLADERESIIYEAPRPPISEEWLLYTWFKEQTLIKIGAIIFFLGAVWFVSYAIEEDWISPLMRIVLGLLLAVAMHTVGNFRRSVEMHYQVLTTLGTGILLGTVVASQFAFQFPILPAWLAFLLMLGGIAYTLFVAYETKTEWLATLSALAGLIVPLLVKVNYPLPILLLVYLLFLSSGLLLVVFLTRWRMVSLALLLGTMYHTFFLQAGETISEPVLWVFIIIFTALFFASTTVSIVRDAKPNMFDVVMMALIVFQYIGYSISIAFIPELALFVGAVVSATVGYLLRLRNCDPLTVALYAAVSLVLILMATVEMFDGYALTVVLAIEALVVYLFSMRVAILERSVKIAALLFALPFASGLLDLQDPIWSTGIYHPEALAVLTVLITTGFAVIWSLRSPVLQAVEWLRRVAGYFLVGWYLFITVATMVMVKSSSAVTNEIALNTFLFTIVTCAMVAYVLRFVPILSWRLRALAALIIPSLSALVLLGDSAWDWGIGHQAFAVSLLWLVVLAVVGIVYSLLGKRTDEQVILGTMGYYVLWAFLGYGYLFISVVWDALADSDLERVTTATSWALLVYLMITILMALRQTILRVTAPLLALIPSALLLLPSLNLSGWQDGIFGVDAAGLYVTVSILCLLGITLSQYRQQVDAEQAEFARSISHGLYWTAGVIAAILVWIESHTVISGAALAVTCALFVYTVVGLLLYTYGRSHEKNEWRRAGFLLLAAVILRLGVVDVWAMEMVWRIVSLLGIGLLFILTALFEDSNLRSMLPSSEDKKKTE